ncbi:unnamed protein product [Calypogeia fissa]
MADIVSRGWERYLDLLQDYPLRTKMITSGALAGASDLVSQKIAGAKTFDYRRAVLMMLYGLIYAGPFGHYWHKLMDRIFAGSKKDSTTIVKKVVVEQLTSNPWNNLFYMCYLGMVLEGRTWTSLKSKLQSEFPGVQLNSWRFWPIVGLINYKYIPLNLRVLFANLAAVCWANFVKWRVLNSTRVPVVNSEVLKKAL